MPKDKGGLGITYLHTQNSCLLKKFLVKLHSQNAPPWHAWFRANYGWSDHRDLGDSRASDTPTWSSILLGLPAFRDATAVSIGDGASTSFWLDLWLDDIPLASRFPALFSHSRRCNISVAKALSDSSLHLHLQPRLSAVAESKLSVLVAQLSLVALDHSRNDTRTL